MKFAIIPAIISVVTWSSCSKPETVKIDRQKDQPAFQLPLTASPQPGTLIDKLDTAAIIQKCRVEDIPAFIRNYLGVAAGGFSLANDNEDWDVGCCKSFKIKAQKPNADGTITVEFSDESLPSRQLVYFGISEELAVMTYSKGGFGRMEICVIFELNKEKITAFWKGYVIDGLTSKTEIVKFLRNRSDNSGSAYEVYL